MRSDPGLPAGAQFDKRAPWNRPDAPRLPYAVRVVFRDCVARYVCPDRDVSDCSDNAERFATVQEAEDERACFRSPHEFISDVVNLSEPENGICDDC